MPTSLISFLSTGLCHWGFSQSVMDSGPSNSDHRGQRDQLTGEQIQEFRKAFKMFDSDNSGTISAQELILVMENLNMNPNEQDISGLLKVRFEMSSG